MDAIVISTRPVNPRKQERTRRKCLELLLPLVGSAGAKLVVMESKSEAQNKRAREMVVSIIRKGWLGDLRLSHLKARASPCCGSPTRY